MRPSLLLLLALALVTPLVSCAHPDPGDYGNEREGEGEGEGEGDEGEGEGDEGEGEGEGDEGEGEGEGEGEPGSLLAGTSTLTLDVDGTDRTMVVIVPAAVSARDLQLVIGLHGNGDSSDNFVLSNGLDDIALADECVLVVPQGIERDVSAFGQNLGVLSWDPYNDDSIDLALFDAIVAHFLATGSIDAAHVHVFGYSQGGYLAFRVGIDRGELLSSVVVGAAASPLGSQLVANAAVAIPFALRIGTNDFGIAEARNSRDALEANGHEVLYEEIAGAGHVPFPGEIAPLFDWLLAR